MVLVSVAATESQLGLINVHLPSLRAPTYTEPICTAIGDNHQQTRLPYAGVDECAQFRSPGHETRPYMEMKHEVRHLLVAGAQLFDESIELRNRESPASKSLLWATMLINKNICVSEAFHICPRIDHITLCEVRQSSSLNPSADSVSFVAPSKHRSMRSHWKLSHTRTSHDVYIGNSHTHAVGTVSRQG
eukprot:5759645-Amphidinium_carterae.3